MNFQRKIRYRYHFYRRNIRSVVKLFQNVLVNGVTQRADKGNSRNYNRQHIYDITITW